MMQSLRLDRLWSVLQRTACDEFFKFYHYMVLFAFVTSFANSSKSSTTKSTSPPSAFVLISSLTQTPLVSSTTSVSSVLRRTYIVLNPSAAAARTSYACAATSTHCSGRIERWFRAARYTCGELQSDSRCNASHDANRKEKYTYGLYAPKSSPVNIKSQGRSAYFACQMRSRQGVGVES